MLWLHDHDKQQFASYRLLFQIPLSLGRSATRRASWDFRRKSISRYQHNMRKSAVTTCLPDQTDRVVLPRARKKRVKALTGLTEAVSYGPRGRQGIDDRVKEGSWARTDVGCSKLMRFEWSRRSRRFAPFPSIAKFVGDASTPSFPPVWIDIEWVGPSTACANLLKREVPGATLAVLA